MVTWTTNFSAHTVALPTITTIIKAYTVALLRIPGYILNCTAPQIWLTAIHPRRIERPVKTMSQGEAR